MVILFLITFAFVLLALAAYRWSVNSSNGITSSEWHSVQLHHLQILKRVSSSDGITSSEWESRQHWFGFH
jgi:hypothetical protein